MRIVNIITVTLLLMQAIPSAAKTEEVTIEGAVGKLSAIVQTPDMGKGEKCDMVVLCHGFSSNKNDVIIKGMAEALEASGIGSIRFDFNGHGDSEGAFENMTVINEIEDAKKVIEYTERLTYCRSVSILGHSQGGVVSAMVAGELGKRRIKSVVLLAPAAVLRDDCIRGNTFGARYDPLDPPASVDLPMGLKLGREFIITAFNLPIYETAAKYKGPAYIAHGTGDRIVPYTYGERFHQIWEGSIFCLINGSDHGLRGLEKEPIVNFIKKEAR